jgi:hypothetical protein
MARSERKVHGHAWAERVDVAVEDATRP